LGGFAGGLENLRCDDLTVGSGDGFDLAGGVGDAIGDGAGVGVELLQTQRFAVEEELDLFGVGVDLYVFCVWALVFRAPIIEQGL
jgi:hypothetical protein